MRARSIGFVCLVAAAVVGSAATSIATPPAESLSNPSSTTTVQLQPRSSTRGPATARDEAVATAERLRTQRIRKVHPRLDPTGLSDIQLTGKAPYVDGEVIVRLTEDTEVAAIANILDPASFRHDQTLVRRMNLHLFALPNGMSVAAAIRELSVHPNVVYAQANHLLTERETYPNDPQFWRQWGLVDQGQSTSSAASPSCAGSCGGNAGGCYCDESCVGFGDCCDDACLYCGSCDGTEGAGADIEAPQAWDYGTGSAAFVIAVVDGSFDLDHPDLVGNLWTNTAEAGGVNGVDDDGNGYVDDINGWDGYNDDGSIPSPGSSHGTHVAGIAGAVGNNGVGITGVAWNARLMAIAGSTTNTAVAATAYGYVIDNKERWLNTNGSSGANVVVTNSSFGIDGADCDASPYPQWNDLYDELGELGILSAAAAPNQNWDIDTVGDVPTGCSSPYLVTVTNHNRNGNKVTGAGFGDITIDLAAPGAQIYSTTNGGNYGNMSGTSMATPHVAGAISVMHSEANASFAALRDVDPAGAALALKEILLDNVTLVASLSTQTVTGGRLNLLAAQDAMAVYCPGLCDDGNACTRNDCSPSGECLNRPGSSNCCESGDGPGCEELTCQQCVCDLDPFCCNNSWDNLCANQAQGACADECTCLGDCNDSIFCTADLCDPTDGCQPMPGNSNCCESSSEPGCNEPKCVDCVCEVDSFCCNNSWDNICAGRAADECSGQCTCEVACVDGNDCTADICDPIEGCLHPALPFETDCCEANGSPSCQEPICAQCVCDADPFCCENTWDNLCATAATSGACVDSCSCDAGCDDGDPCTENDACSGGACSSGTPLACDDGDVCTWSGCDPDLGCFNEPGDSDCCATSDSPGCAENTCQNCVCAADPFCCNNSWDGLCVDRALGLCADSCTCNGDCSDGEACTADACDPELGCVNPAGPSDCCTATGGQGCEEPACTECVCNADPFCCNNSWDNLCAQQALVDCAESCTCGTFCDDGDTCTDFDECSGGLCVGEAADCDDGIACTVDSCNPLTGCTHLPNNLLCPPSPLGPGVCDADLGCVTIDKPPVCISDKQCQAGLGPCKLGVCLQGQCITAPDPDCCPNGDCHPCSVASEITGDSVVSVTDVQCSLVLILWELGGSLGAPPSCLALPLESADADCSGGFSVADVQLALLRTLNVPLSKGVDANQDLCPDTCQ